MQRYTLENVRQIDRGLHPGMTNPVSATKVHRIRQAWNHRRCSRTVRRLRQDHRPALILWSIRHTTEHILWEFNSNSSRTRSILPSIKKEPYTSYVVTNVSDRCPYIPFLSILILLPDIQNLRSRLLILGSETRIKYEFLTYTRYIPSPSHLL